MHYPATGSGYPRSPGGLGQRLELKGVIDDGG
jgi:hypothetical protein